MKKKRNTNYRKSNDQRAIRRVRTATWRMARALRSVTRRRRLPKRSRLTTIQRKARLERLQEQRREEQDRVSGLRHKKLMRKKRIAARRPKRYTYANCLRDEVPVPTKSNGTTLYQTLVVGGMTAIMVTISGVGAEGVSFIVQDRWLYPVVFSISLLTRIYITAPLSRILESRLPSNRLQGTAQTIASTVLGTALSSPVTCAIVTLLFADEDSMKGYADAYLASLSATAPLSVLVSFFVVGPLAKLVFNNRIKPAGGLRMLGTLIEHTGSITRIFGF